MKKCIILLTTLILLISCSQPKTAFIDVEEILKEYKGTKDAEKEMNKKSDALKKELDQLAVEYQTKVRDYYAKVQRMSNKDRQQTEQMLQQENQILAQRQQQAQQEVQKEGQERMDEINETIEDFVAEYARKNGYSYIFGTSDQTKSVIYGDTNLDLTDEILEALNDSYKKEENNSNVDEKDSIK